MKCEIAGCTNDSKENLKGRNICEIHAEIYKAITPECLVGDCSYEATHGNLCETHFRHGQATDENQCVKQGCRNQGEFVLVGLKFCKVHYAMAKVQVQDVHESFECEEPRCRFRATKVWNGRKVCNDHFEEYQDKQARYVDEMDK